MRNTLWLILGNAVFLTNRTMAVGADPEPSPHRLTALPALCSCTLYHRGRIAVAGAQGHDDVNCFVLVGSRQCNALIRAAHTALGFISTLWEKEC